MAVLDSATRFFGHDAIQDPYPLYDRMRAEAPVHRIGDSVFYAVCGWDSVQEAVDRVEDFSSNLTATMVYHEDGTVTPLDMGQPGAPMHALATADDPVHAMHRKILLPHLSAKRVRIIEEFAVQTADRLWEENLHDGQIEWMSAIANRLPMMVVCKLLGLPDDDVDTLIRLGYATTTLLDGIVTPEQLGQAGLAAMELSGYVLEPFRKGQRQTRFRADRRLGGTLRVGRTRATAGAGNHAHALQRGRRIDRVTCWAARRGSSPIAPRSNGSCARTRTC